MKNKFDISIYKPCEDGIEWYNNQPNSIAAWNNCHRGDWMLWIASYLSVDKRALTLAKGKCAETVIHLMKDEQSRDAVKAAIDYGNGLIDDNELITAADAAAYAAYAADAAYAAYAAYAASYAASYAAYAASYASYAAYAASYAAYAAADAAAAYAAAASYASYAASYAADAADDAAADAAAYAAAKKENQMKTANICREILTNEILSFLINKQQC